MRLRGVRADSREGATAPSVSREPGCAFGGKTRRVLRVDSRGRRGILTRLRGVRNGRPEEWRGTMSTAESLREWRWLLGVAALFVFARPARAAAQPEAEPPPRRMTLATPEPPPETEAEPRDAIRNTMAFTRYGGSAWGGAYSTERD